MDQTTLLQIEKSFQRLPISEQLCLIERLVHHIHESTLKKNEELDKQLAVMAEDPEIQNELQQIEREFALTESDGLEFA